MTGTSTKHYLISQRKEYQNEITVPSSIQVRPNEDGYFVFVPFLKIYTDIDFYEVLVELDSIKDSISSQDLFSRIKAKNTSTSRSLLFEEFKRRYLLKLYGLGYTIYDIEKDKISISEEGKKFVGDELQYFLEMNDVIDKQENSLAQSKSWSWFQEQKL